jgi:uncharacterized protein (DUF305 family)
VAARCPRAGATYQIRTDFESKAKDTHMKHVSRTTAATTTLIIAGVLGLAGCGDGNDHGSMPGMTPATQSGETPTGAATPTGEHNDADVTFASQMIPHHQQAVQMANMAGYQATTPAVKQLATTIKAAQDPEIQQLTAWLTSWGKPVPSPIHGGHSMSEPMAGMMTEDEMSDLGNARGGMFDRMWTQMMIKHHQGAVMMAKSEQTTGKNAAALALAKKIETAQNAEIATMQRLLGRLPVS